MWRVIFISFFVLCGVTNSQAVGAYAGSYASSNGGVGGYTGHYDDYDYYGYAPDFGFGFGFIDPYLFHQQLTAHNLAQLAAHQNAIASTFTLGDATVTAGASNQPSDYQDYDDELFNRHRAAYFGGNKGGNRYNYKGTKGNRYAPNYAAAAASAGPKGGYHTAFISPANPAVPNVSNRFSSTSPGGYKGVSVSSYSSSSNINGKKSSHRGAQTTINDNGRITTYKVDS